MSGLPVQEPRGVGGPSAGADSRPTGSPDQPGPIRDAVSEVGDAAGAVRKAAGSVGEAVPVLAGATDRIAAVAGGVQVASDAVDAVGNAVDDLPGLSPELRRERERLLAGQLAEVRASREEFYGEMEELEARGRAALDVRASLKRQPAQIAGLAAGTGFVLLGGPGRAWKFIRGRVLPRATRPPLPPALNGVLRSMGDDGTAAQELADMITAATARRRPGRVQRLLAGSLFLPLGLAWGRKLIARLLDVDPAVRERELARIRVRNAARIAEAAETAAAAEASAIAARAAGAGAPGGARSAPAGPRAAADDPGADDPGARPPR